MEAKLLKIASSSALAHFTSDDSQSTSLFAYRRSSALQFPISRCLKNNIITNQASSVSAVGYTQKKRVDESEMYTLDGIRNSLIRQEESIIFSLVERAQFCFNAATYDPNAFAVDGFHGSLVEYMVKETEKLHAMVLHSAAHLININVRVWNMYFQNLLPRLVKEGDDGNYGSTATCDTLCLQTLSKRIHYGKFVAEAKFLTSPDVYKTAIKAQINFEKTYDRVFEGLDDQKKFNINHRNAPLPNFVSLKMRRLLNIYEDGDELMNLLTYTMVEEAITKRVEVKTRKYGEEVNPTQFPVKTTLNMSTR